MYKVPKQNIANADYVYPRTLEEAFGPYERWGKVVEKDAQPEMDWEDKAVLWAAPVAVIFFIVLLVLES